MNDSEISQTEKEVLCGRVRRLTDRQLRLAVYLAIDGWTLAEAFDLAIRHFISEQKGKVP